MNLPDELIEMLSDPSTTITETVYDGRSVLDAIAEAVEKEGLE